MQLKLARFHTQKYNCLSPDLNGLRAFVAYTLASRKLAEKDNELEQSRREVPKGMDLADKIIGYARARNESLANPMERMERLQALCGQLERALTKTAAHLPSDHTTLANRIASLYAVFDEQRFLADFKQAFPNAHHSDARERILMLEMEVDELREEVAAAWPDDEEKVNGYFVGGKVPEVWEGSVKGPRNTAFVLATRIHQQFLNEWQERAPQFHPAVTISGVQIDSIPEPRQTAWRELYGILGFARLKKFVRYRSIKFQAAAPEADYGDTIPGIPDAFRKQSAGRRPAAVESAVESAE